MMGIGVTIMVTSSRIRVQQSTAFFYKSPVYAALHAYHSGSITCFLRHSSRFTLFFVLFVSANDTIMVQICPPMMEFSVFLPFFAHHCGINSGYSRANGHCNCPPTAPLWCCNPAKSGVCALHSPSLCGFAHTHSHPSAYHDGAKQTLFYATIAVCTQNPRQNGALFVAFRYHCPSSQSHHRCFSYTNCTINRLGFWERIPSWSPFIAKTLCF